MEQELQTANTTSHQVGDTVTWLGQAYTITELFGYHAWIRNHKADISGKHPVIKTFINELNLS